MGTMVLLEAVQGWSYWGATKNFTRTTNCSQQRFCCESVPNGLIKPWVCFFGHSGALLHALWFSYRFPVSVYRHISYNFIATYNSSLAFRELGDKLYSLEGLHASSFFMFFT